MKRDIFIFLLIVCASVLSSSAQSTFQKQIVRTNLSEIRPTTDSGFIAVGWMLGPGGAILIKGNSVGDTMWTKVFNESLYVEGFSVDQTTDGGYILTGSSGGSTDSGKVYLIRTNSLGDTLWTRKIGGKKSDEGRCIRQSFDGGFIISGRTNSFGAIVNDVYVVKTDSVGNVEWSKAFGGSKDDKSYSVCQTADSGFTVLGSFNTFNIDGYFSLIKLNKLGDTLWTKSYNITANDMGFGINETYDHGFIVLGWANYLSNRDIFLLRTDSVGNLKWSKQYGGTGDDSGLGVNQTSDSGFVICGYTTSFNAIKWASYVLRVDSIGNVLWSKMYNYPPAYSIANSVLPFFDGGYIVAGEEVELMKLNSTGATGCETTVNTVTSIPQTKILHPNFIQIDANSVSNNSTTFFIASDSIINLCVPPLPIANFISSDTIFCAESGKCIDFFDHSINNPTAWQWYFPGAIPGTSTQQNPTNICYNTPGTYAVKLVATNSSGKDSIIISPMITFGAAAAKPILTFSNDTIYCNYAATYQWYYNGSLIPGATNSYYVITGDGTYAVQITDNDGCTQLSDGYVITGEKDLEKNGIKIYPNPAEKILVISHQSLMNREIKIFNVLGEIVFSHYSVLNTSYSIDVSVFAKGIYLVEASEGEKVFRAKFLKQ